MSNGRGGQRPDALSIVRSIWGEGGGGGGYSRPYEPDPNAKGWSRAEIFAAAEKDREAREERAAAREWEQYAESMRNRESQRPQKWGMSDASRSALSSLANRSSLERHLGFGDSAPASDGPTEDEQTPSQTPGVQATHQGLSWAGKKQPPPKRQAYAGSAQSTGMWDDDEERRMT